MMRPGHRRKLRRILLRAATLVDRGWTQQTFARQANGAPCGELNKEAALFCMVGAVNRAASDLKAVRLVYPARGEVDKHLGCSATVFNDVKGRTQTEVAAQLRATVDERLPPSRLERFWAAIFEVNPQ